MNHSGVVMNPESNVEVLAKGWGSEHRSTLPCLTSPKPEMGTNRQREEVFFFCVVIDILFDTWWISGIESFEPRPFFTVHLNLQLEVNKRKRSENNWIPYIFVDVFFVFSVYLRWWLTSLEFFLPIYPSITRRITLERQK